VPEVPEPPAGAVADEPVVAGALVEVPAAPRSFDALLVVPLRSLMAQTRPPTTTITARAAKTQPIIEPSFRFPVYAMRMFLSVMQGDGTTESARARSAMAAQARHDLKKSGREMSADRRSTVARNAWPWLRR